MDYNKKPKFIIKKNSQKNTNKFKDILTDDILKDVCIRVTGKNDFECEYVENDYSDDFLSDTYNKGRLAVLLYDNTATYISFSEEKIEGRNSSVQSVATAFNLFFDNKKANDICYYFLPLKKGNLETNYLMFIYRLMKTIGIKFINAEDVLSQEISKFTSIEDIISSRILNAKKNSSNNSTYMTKSSSKNIEIYGKTYGANKYETSLICYAISYLCKNDYSIKLYQIEENNLIELPQSSLKTIREMGKIEYIPTNMKLEKQSFDEDNSLRSPRFIYNLLDKLGPKKCAICGCEIPELVQGAHIWPVADIKRKPFTLEDKLKYATDGENGIWLCENHHKLFDRNLLIIDIDGRILYNKELEKQYNEFIKDTTKISKLHSNIITDKFVYYLNKRYETNL